MSDYNRVFVYGMPVDVTSPRMPEAQPIPMAPQFVPVMVPCVRCARHHYYGSSCPFCVAEPAAEKIAQAPSPHIETRSVLVDKDKLQALVDAWELYDHASILNPDLSTGVLEAVRGLLESRGRQ